MKKLVFISLGLFLVFSHSQNLNLNSLKAETAMSCIASNPNLIKIFNACQNNNKFAQDKMNKISEKLRIKLVCICNFAEKIELLKFKKDPILSNLFGRLFSEFGQNVAGLINIDFNNVNKSISKANKTMVENLASEILRISRENGNKLDISISSVMAFLNPSSTEHISQKQIKRVLNQTLSTLAPEELNALKTVIYSKAFVKIASKLDELTGIVLATLMEEDTKPVGK